MCDNTQKNSPTQNINSCIALKDVKGSVIINAIQSYNYTALEAFLNAGISIEQNTLDNALALAGLNGTIKMVKLLIKHGANPNNFAEEAYGRGVLHQVVVGSNRGPQKIKRQRYHLDILSFYLKSGIDVNLQDKDGSTALHYAATGKNYEIVEFLLKNNATMEIVNNEAHTPLQRAIQYQFTTPQIIDLLTKKHN